MNNIKFSRIILIFIIINLKKKKNVWGTGLGLSLSKRIASLMDIDLTYDSTYKNGSKFSIIIIIEKFKDDKNGENHTSKYLSNFSSKISFDSKINSNHYINKDKSENSCKYDSSKKETLLMSGIRIINRKGSIISYFDENLSGQIDSDEDSSKGKNSLNNSKDIYYHRFFTNSNIKTENLYDRIIKKKQTSKNLEKKRSLLSVDYNYKKSNIQKISGVLEKEEEIIKNKKIHSPYKYSFSHKKIKPNIFYDLNTSTSRTTKLNMLTDIKINPLIKKQVLFIIFI